MWKLIPEEPKSRKKKLSFSSRFRSKARFLVDENLGPHMASFLKEAKYHVEFAPEVGLRGHSDEDLHAHAWRNRLVLVTQDERLFTDDRHYPFQSTHGLIVLSGGMGSDKSHQNQYRALVWVSWYLAPYWKAHVGEKVKITSDKTFTLRGVSREDGRQYEIRIKFENGHAYEWIDEEKTA